MSAVLQTERYVDSGADISGCLRYRYWLWREWRGAATDENWSWFTDDDGEPVLDGKGVAIGEPKTCVFVMLNPSTADGSADDATIRKCVAFAKAWCFDRIDVLNLFAYRATDPAALLALNDEADPVGPANLEAFETVLLNQPVGRIVCAWGVHGSHLGQDQTALGWIAGIESRFRALSIFALGLTKDGQPKHPLYLPRNTPLVPFGRSPT